MVFINLLQAVYPVGAVYISTVGGGRAMSLVQRSYNLFAWRITA